MGSMGHTDALYEVLLRVDPTNIVRFLATSKDWLEAIKEPSFREAYKKKWRSDELVGFLVEDPQLLNSRTGQSSRRLHELHPLPPVVQLLPTSEFGRMMNRKRFIPENLGSFLAKSSGLILSGVHPKTYHVFEPLKRRVDQLSRPAKRCPRVAIAIMSYQDGYKVIQAKVEKVEKKSLFIQTYSSPTRTWEEKSKATCSSMFSVRVNGVGVATRAGLVFWMATTRHLLPCIAALDTTIDEPRIHLLKPPFPHTGSKNLTESDFDSDPDTDYHYSGRSVFYSENPDGFLRCATCCTSVINIWVLDHHDFSQEPNFDGFEDFEVMVAGGAAGWSRVYVIDLQEMWVNNSKLPSLGLNANLPFFFVSFLDEKWDIYVRWKELVFLYHLDTGILEWVPYYLDDGGYQFPEKNAIRRLILHPLTMTELGAWP